MVEKEGHWRCYIGNEKEKKRFAAAAKDVPRISVRMLNEAIRARQESHQDKPETGMKWIFQMNCDYMEFTKEAKFRI